LVVAESRRSAKEILLRDSGHVPKTVRGVDNGKLLYDESGRPAETAADILKRITEPQLYGVEK
jgi:hypothetical protein